MSNAYSARELVKEAIKHHPRRKAGVAIEIGYSRTALSRYMSGSYGAGREIEEAIRERYLRIACPHRKIDITPDICRRTALAPCPTSNVTDVRQWKACQSCAHKPQTTPLSTRNQETA